MADKLRDQLIGAWKLVSYVEKSLNGFPPDCPMGEQPAGIIMYTPDGYMSAQLMRANPGHFASGDWFKDNPRGFTTRSWDRSSSSSMP
jgi:hypothetical protein